MNRYLNEDSTNIIDCLDMLMRSMSAANEMHYSLNYPSFVPAEFGYTVGKKYAKVFIQNREYAPRCDECDAKQRMTKQYIECEHDTPIVNGQRFVCFFVQLDNGDVWKAGGWSGPTLNFVRGNIVSKAGRRALSFDKIATGRNINCYFGI